MLEEAGIEVIVGPGPRSGARAAADYRRSACTRETPTRICWSGWYILTLKRRRLGRTNLMVTELGWERWTLRRSMRAGTRCASRSTGNRFR